MNTADSSPAVTIIGAGLSGLATAWQLANAGARVTVLERSNRTGGVIRSERKDGFLCEAAPNSMLIKSQSAEDFLTGLGLADEIVDANPLANKRFLVRDGKVIPLPMSLMGGITTPLYTLRAKFRVLAEPFIKPYGGEDESVASFVTRRMGREFLDYGIASLVSGIFAGDPERLSIRHAFPKVWNLEARFGSMIGGAIKLGRERKRSGEKAYKSRMISFRDGVETLTRRLAESSAANIRTNAAISSIERGENGWVVRWSGPDGEHISESDALIVSVSETDLGSLPWSAALGLQVDDLPSLHHPPVTTLVMGFRREQVAHPMDGFGMLIPLVEGRRVLGAIFSSTIFPDRAPDGHVSLMIFMGGATMPESAKTDADEAVDLACAELGDLLGIDGRPVFSSLVHWPLAIPQYNVGHGQFISAIESVERNNPGLHFTANYRGGPGLSDCLDSAIRTSSKVLEGKRGS